MSATPDQPRRFRASQQDIETIKSRVNLADLIGSSVKLRRVGSVYKGLCPFHDEKTPSFTVNPEINRFHCLAAETLVRTPAGDQRIDALAGTVATVMDGNGDWVEAPVRDFGIQRLSKVTLSRNGVRKVIYATPEHRWYVRPKNVPGNSAPLTEMTTADLTPRTRIPTVWPRSKANKRIKPSPFGIMAGFTFGDGTTTNNGCTAYFHGPKIEVAKYFEQAGIRVAPQSDGSRYQTMGNQLPRSWKTTLPAMDEGAAYLTGWLAGLIAADGCVDQDGRVTVSNADITVIDYVERLCNHLGFGVMARHTQTRRGYGATESQVHVLAFRGKTLSPSLFIRTDQREGFARSQASKKHEQVNWWVVSVEATDRVEHVYCATVSTTHSFVLESGILTGNCFGCHESGDAIDFVSRTQGGDFRFAIEYLANQTGYTLTEDADAPFNSGPGPSRLIAANEAAHALYAQALNKSPDAQQARLVLTSRGFTGQDAARFGCGYAYRDAMRELRDQGFTFAELEAAGLVAADTKRAHFHDRLTWAIRNGMGRVIGFGARQLSDSTERGRKFINTPATSIYDKSNALYGIDLARTTFTKEARAVIVEGYADVMAMTLAGVPAVATCGTALTPGHIATLRRIVGPQGELVFAFDGDTAGRKASLAAYRLAHTQLPRLSVLPFPDGTDPDDYRRAHGNTALADLMERRSPLIEAAISATLADVPLATPDDKIAALPTVIDILKDVEDPWLVEQHARFAARLLGLPPYEVSRRIPVRGRQTPIVITPERETAVAKEQQVLAAMLMDRESTAKHLPIAKVLLTHPASRTLLDALARALAEPDPGPAGWPDLILTMGEDVPKLASPLLVLGCPANDVPAHVSQLLSIISDERDMQAEVQTLSTIAAADTDEAKAAALLALMEHLDVTRE